MSVSIQFLPIALAMLDRAVQAEEKTGDTHRDTIEPIHLPTAFTDADLLLKTLRDFGARPMLTANGDIVCSIEQCELRFMQEDGQPFSVEIFGAASVDEINRHLDNLDEDYRRCVQTAVYEKVKAHAESRGLMLESEDVLEDRTILLTLRVR